MSPTVIDELRAVLEDEEVKKAIASAQAQPERESAKRLLLLHSVAIRVLEGRLRRG